MQKPKLIFFDAGGTLVAPREAVGETYARLARSYGHSVDAQTLQAGFLKHFHAQPPLAFPNWETEAELQRLEYEWWRRLVFDVLASESLPRFDEFFAEAFEHYRQPTAWRLFDDVLPTLQALNERGVQCAVLSNFDSRLFDLLAGFGLSRYFSGVHISARMGVAKPDGRIFEAALQTHGLQAHEAWHVGDSLREDVAGAGNAGIKAWLIERGGNGEGGALTRLDQLVALAV